jgi:hypothetical protein
MAYSQKRLWQNSEQEVLVSKTVLFWEPTELLWSKEQQQQQQYIIIIESPDF